MAKILVVDDVATNRELVVTLAKHLGHLTLEAADGEEALAMVSQEHPELVICDILMPTMDGYEFVRRLRADPEVANTEVIYYSAYYRARDAAALARSCGVAQVISKPSEPADMLRIISEVLAKKPSISQIAVDQNFDHEHLRVMTNELALKAEELQATNDRFSALIELNLKLASENNSQSLFEQVCHGARDLIGARYAVLAMRDGTDTGAEFFCTSGVDESLSAALTISYADNLIFEQFFAEQSPRRMLNASGKPELLGFPHVYAPVQCGLVVPLRPLEKCDGWIFLAGRLARDAFTQEDERLLATLCAQVGKIYENGRLYRSLEVHAERLRAEIVEREQASQARLEMINRLTALRALDNKILEAHLPEDVASVALEYLAGLVPFWAASIRLFDYARGEDTLLAKGSDPEFLFKPTQSIVLTKDSEYELETLRKGEIYRVENLLDLTVMPSPVEVLVKQGMRSYIRVPIMFEGVLGGSLNIAADRNNFFTEDFIDVAKAITDQLGIALLQAKLRKHISLQAAELEQRVVERTAQLESANRDLEAFSYTVAHDLSGPLNRMSGLANMLIKGITDGDFGQLPMYAQRISHNATGMSALVSDLLDFSHASHGELAVERVAVGEIVEEVIQEQKVRETAQCTVDVLPLIDGDSALIRQVWSNLISNALKYSAKAPTPLISISGEVRALEAVFTIRDNGAGFDHHKADRLFGVFQRLHAPNEFEGTGLGLAIVRRIVERHGGRVWAEGRRGEGAAFFFALPIDCTEGRVTGIAS